MITATTHQKDYIVFKLDLANYLISNGIQLLRTKPSKQNTGKLVFMFPYNEDTINLVEQYKQLHTK